MNRDSLLLTLGIIGAVIGYLIAAGEPPNAWSYQEWLQAAAFAVGVLAAKLSTSPLPHSEEGDMKVTPSGR
jgi:basic membrane lipoprotein Med (substrate-binding protein (PBP1-ABC) superfamily)